LSERTDQLDVLFIGEHAVWPLDQGFCIRGYNMANALRERGLKVGLSSIEPPPADAPQNLHDMAIDWPDARHETLNDFLKAWQGPAYKMRMRLADYQGRDLPRFAAVRDLVKQTNPKLVVGLGQHSTMMLRGLWDQPQLKRVWYAADELVRFQISCLKREGIGSVRMRMQKLALYAGLEACFVRGMDGAIGVSPKEAELLRRIAGARQTTTIRNGVDLDYFRPDRSARQKEKTLVFWGRMDFEPNVDAVCWFADNIWPTIRLLCPQARWQIIGKKPITRVLALDERDGIEVLGEVADIRDYARNASLTVLPMRCGGGIKNKLLEAAAMGLPIVASTKAVQGLDLSGSETPMTVCKSQGEWIESICRLWADSVLRERIARNARDWAERRHSWYSAAGQFIEFANRIGASIDHHVADRARQSVTRHWKEAA